MTNKNQNTLQDGASDLTQGLRQAVLDSGGRVVTWRAVVIGLLLSLLSCLWITYSSYIGKSASIPVAHFPVAALLPFVIVSLGINPLLKVLGWCRPLAMAELLVIFFMLLTASAIPGWAFTTYWVALVGTPLYFATPQNRWEAVFFDYLPDWLVASNQGGVMEWFFEGLPAGNLIPWGAWIPPFVWWSSFFLALFVVGACLMIVLRKQWVDYEKLSFPLAQVPVLMAQDDPQGRAYAPFMRDRLFWIGFGITMSVLLWNMASYFRWLSPIQLGISYALSISVYDGFPPLLFRLNWLVFGFAFFANLDVLFSIWVFRLLAICQEGTLAQFGYNLSSPNTGISSLTAAQHLGGFFFFVLWGLWMARRHLLEVMKRAVARPSNVDDSDELLSYRWALLGILTGVVYILCWLNRAGMELWVASLLMACVLLMYLGVTRIVAEAGVVLLDLPLNAHDFTISVIGSSNMSHESLTSMGMANAFARNWRTLGMNAMAHVAKVGDQFLSEKRKIFGVVFLSLGVGIVASVTYTIYLAYTTVGAAHFGEWGFSGGNTLFYDNIVKWISTPTELGSEDLGFIGFGAAVMWALIQLRYQFPGWPLHPVGFAIAGAFATDQAAFSVFLAWLIKIGVMKMGGVSLYRKTQPLFLGILVGFSVGVAISFAIDYVWFPRQGHLIDSW